MYYDTHSTKEQAGAPRPAMNGLNRANIRPVAHEEIFTISTEQAKAYLQAKVNAIPGLENVSIAFGSMSIARNFKPFIVMFPKTVEAREKGKDGKDVADDAVAALFRADSDNGSGRSIKLPAALFKLISAYTFDSSFREMEKNRQMRELLGISRNGINTMERIRKLHYETFHRTGTQMIAIAIDPVLLFADMLCVDGEDNRQYAIQITDITGVDTKTHFMYRVVRVPKSKGKGNVGDEIEEVIRRYCGT